ncbi:MAG: PAS domain S-box protein [Syntrophaceae bacterium]|nr:PAS domain S-box protein [Syntrophaceae bacterium]
MVRDAFLTFRSWFRPPVFPDDEFKTGAARVLATMLALMSALALFSLFVAVPFIYGKKLASAATSLFALLVVLGGYLLMHRGSIRAAGAFVIAGLWIHFLVVVILGSGMKDTNLVQFVVLPAVAGLILGWRAAIWTIALAILTGLTLAVLEIRGFLPLYFFPQPPLARWVTIAFGIVLLAATLRQSFRTQEDLLQSARAQLRERMKVEEALRRRTEQVSAVTSSLPGLVYQFYARPNGEMGLNYLSDRAAELFGISRDAATFFDDFSSRLHADDYGRFMNSIAESIAAFRRWDFEGRFVKESGDLIWFRGLSVPTRRGDETVFNGILLDVTDRRRAEEALRESENRFRVLADAAREGILIHKDGVIFDANESAFSMFGYEPREAIGKSVLDFLAPESVPAALAKLAEADAPELYLEAVGLRKDGTVFPMEIFGRPITYRNIRGRVLAIRDLSARRAAEEALRRTEQRYSTILEEIEEGYVEFDDSGRVTFCNESFRRAMGYEADEIIGSSYKRFTADEDVRRDIARAYGEMFRTGAPLRMYELDLLTRTGERRTVEHSASLIRDAEGRPTGFRGVFRDITERIRAEEQYRVMANNSQAGEFIAIEGKFRFVNRHVLQYGGYTEPEMIGVPTMQFVHPEDREMVREKARQMLKGAAVSPYEYRIVKKSGESRWLLESVTRITYEGRPAVLGNNMDVTEIREAREKLEHMQEQLLQAQKLESLGTLAGGIAHDFNNLLMGIQGYASLMMLDLKEGHPHLEKLKAIESQIRSGAELTRQLLGLARGGRYEVKPTDLNELVGKTARMFGRTKKEIRIDERYEGGLWSVEADGGQLEQVFLNLFVNAWQAMPGGGDLSLTTSNVELDESFCRIYGIKPGSYVKVTVSDTGVGMDERTRQRIFDPFFTTKEMGRGTGLGLASAYGILKGHGGIITVSSEKGRGTTFEIYLPASGEAVVREEPSVSGIEPGRGVVLVVDDEPMVREVTREMLSGLGYTVLTAASGAEALEVYGSRGTEIDVVVLDMIMPGMGGGEVNRELQMRNPSVRVLLSSGYSLDGEASEILEKGVRGFLQKPFRLEELSLKIREAMES